MNTEAKEMCRYAVDVLQCKVITAAVFHFERSTLNVVAMRNAVGVYMYRIYDRMAEADQQKI